MIIKNKDDCQDQIDYLSDLLERDFSDEKKSLIEREINSLTSDKKDEDSAAYFLNINFKSSKDWLVIHDLRLEHEGTVAQIDHLLIGRMMDIYVIDSINFNSGVSISEEGQFSYFYEGKPFTCPSPINQNKDKIDLLDKFLIAHNLLPRRLSIVLKPNYKSIVLISPAALLIKPTKGVYDCSSVMKADKFLQRFNVADENLSTMANLAKVLSQESLALFAEKLALQHKPHSIDYKAKFALDGAAEVASPECPRCKKAMVKRSAKKGKTIGNEFWGCSDFPKCKGVIKIEKAVAAKEKPVVVKAGITPSCPKCHGTMIKRVNKKGANAGTEFWGCSKFPKCRGVVSIEV